MEKLKEYLKNRTQKEFADQVGISPAYLSQILKGRRIPHGRVIAAIEDATGSAVLFRDWYPDGNSHPGPTQ